jgi:hypothetical protein
MDMSLYTEAEQDRIHRAVTFSQAFEQRLDMLLRECSLNRLDRLAYANDMHRIEKALERIETIVQRIGGKA